VKTRRLLVAHGITGFEREFPLEWDGRVHRFDFGFEATRTILETNGRRWHDDPTDDEDDNEKWSVPGVTGTASCSRPGTRSLGTRSNSSTSERNPNGYVGRAVVANRWRMRPISAA
jgi:hypothetical protein